jgi:hypothetical protein
VQLEHLADFTQSNSKVFLFLLTQYYHAIVDGSGGILPPIHIFPQVILCLTKELQTPVTWEPMEHTDCLQDVDLNIRFTHLKVGIGVAQ